MFAYGCAVLADINVVTTPSGGPYIQPTGATGQSTLSALSSVLSPAGLSHQGEEGAGAGAGRVAGCFCHQ